MDIAFYGFLWSMLVQLLQKLNVPGFKSGQKTALSAIFTLVGVVVALIHAAVEPGGMANIDGPRLLQTGGEAILFLAGAAATHYQFFKSTASRT